MQKIVTDSKPEIPKKIKEELLNQAIKRHPDKELEPCGYCKELMDGFTAEKYPDGSLDILFWYNIGRNTFAERKIYYE